MRVNEIIHGEISSNDNQLPGSSHTQAVGHSKVCLMCGCSILRRKSDQILRSNPSELQQMIATIIINSIEPRELTTTDRVCHSCWMKTRRTALCMQVDQTERESVALPSTSMVVEESQAEQDIVTPEQPPSAIEQSEIADNEDIPEQRSDEVDIVVPNPSGSSTSSEWIPGVSSVVTQNVPAQGVTITLDNYRRAPNTAAQCIFSYCTNRELHRISDDLRIKVIIDHHFYLPIHARVCTDHLLSNIWDTLYNSENSNAVFTVEQVEHMFSFINFSRNNVIDFNDPLNIDDRLDAHLDVVPM